MKSCNAPGFAVHDAIVMHECEIFVPWLHVESKCVIVLLGGINLVNGCDEIGVCYRLDNIHVTVHKLVIALPLSNGQCTSMLPLFADTFIL